MLSPQYLYSLLLVLSLAGPLILSFDRKVAFYKNFRFLLPAILIMAIPFIIWDILFAAFGFWGFNPYYLSGPGWMGLPIEEILFFIIVPYCCVFIYEVANAYVKKDYLGPYSASISNFLMGFTGSIAVIFYSHWYTFLTFLIITILIFWHSRLLRTPWLGRFYFAFIFMLIPFLVINGILTGMGLDEPVVWYSDAQIIGIRIFTIPLEDVFYGMILILGVITIYERLKGRERN